MHCKEWNPNTMHSKYVRKIAKCQKLASSIPFAEAKEIIIDLVDTEVCKVDVFIDDIITVAVDSYDNLDRIIAAPCTVMHAVTHHATDNETFVPRQEFISEDKNEAEGAPSEEKIMLGW